MPLIAGLKACLVDSESYRWSEGAPSGTVPQNHGERKHDSAGASMGDLKAREILQIA
jgi:hypothetical protein